MGALVIAMWAIALAGGWAFPPIFIVPIYCTYLWRKQRKQRKLAKLAQTPNKDWRAF